MAPPNPDDMIDKDSAIDETTPLIPAGPITADASAEAEIDTHSPGSSPRKASGSTTPELTPVDEGHTTANQSLSRARATFCTIALGCLIFLQATNISLLTTTQSAIADELVAHDKTTWFTSSYLIAMSALGPLNGKLASVFSPRSCMLASSVFVALGAVIASGAKTFGAFVAGRAVIGVGASGVFTISIILVLELSGSKRRGIAVGLLNSGYTVGVALGATAAGALLPIIGWRALFWTQAPIAFLAGLALYLAIPHDFTAGHQHDSGRSSLKQLVQLDYVGAITLTGAIVLLLFAMSDPVRIPVTPVILSGVVIITFLINELYIAHDPIIPVSLLKSRGLLLTCLATVGYMMARWSVLFYAPTYAIAVRQWSPATAGSILIPTNGGFATGGLLVGWLHIKRQGSFYIPAVVCYALFPCTLVALAFLSTQNSSPVLIVSVLFCCGALTGAALNYNLAHLLHVTPKSTHYVATSLLATFRGFAGSFGTSIGGGLFTRALNTSLTEYFDQVDLQHKSALIKRLLGSPALVGNLGGVEKAIAVRGYEDALKALWLSAAALALVTAFVQAGTGWTGPGERSVLEGERARLVHCGVVPEERNAQA